MNVYQLAMLLLTCSGLMCSDVGKTSGYDGRSNTRSRASSCCWVKASALRCFRKLSTLPWESLFGPEPSEPSMREERERRPHASRSHYGPISPWSRPPTPSPFLTAQDSASLSTSSESRDEWLVYISSNSVSTGLKQILIAVERQHRGGGGGERESKIEEEGR